MTPLPIHVRMGVGPGLYVSVLVLAEFDGIAIRITTKQRSTAGTARRVMNAGGLQSGTHGIQVGNGQRQVPIAPTMRWQHAASIGVIDLHQVQLNPTIQRVKDARKAELRACIPSQPQHALIEGGSRFQIRHDQTDMV